MEKRIKKFRSLEKKFFISGLVLTIVGFLVAIIFLNLFIFSIVDAASSLPSTATEEEIMSAIDIVTYYIYMFLYIFGFLSGMAGVALIVVSKAVWRTKARNLERLENVNSISK